MHYVRSHILICSGTGCSSSGSAALMETFEKELDINNLSDEVKVVKTGCFGLCALGPMVIIYPEGVFYNKVKASDIKEIISEHIVKGRIVSRLVFDESLIDESTVRSLNEVDFYKKQHRLALRNCGLIDPENIEEYIANDGYEALGRVLTTMEPTEVIDILIESGLRGRGGGGFPAGLKWRFTKDAPGTQKYVACNADEGDPGAFMDRSILEGDPHVLIEAMSIAGYATGANFGFVYVRAEYPIAVKRLQKAIVDAKAYGLLGENVFNSGFSFDMEIRLGAGAFVCGEETALISSIEGKRGEPTPRPPFPAQSGVFKKPTVLNNVETLANVPQILLKGAPWFRSIGTEKSPGTKVFAVGGKINNTGLVEVPMGTTLKEVVFEIGGGIPDNKQFKAAQTGGPSGGCIPYELINTPIDFDSLTAIGSMMGSGGLIIMDEDNCMVDIAKYFLEFTVDESCGKCPPCRIGTKRMLEILTKITKGNGKLEDLDKLEDLAYAIKSTALCGLGQTAPNPVLATLKFFREEYEAHVIHKHCPAGACKSLTSIIINKGLCKACSLCKPVCPVGAISGERRKAHEIDQSLCTKCQACIPVCPFGAIVNR